MRYPASFAYVALGLLAACSSAQTTLPQSRAASRGAVSVSFTIPFAPPHAADVTRRPQYFSPSSTSISIALKSVNGIAVSTPRASTFDLSDICRQSGAIFYCSTTLSELSGDDVLGVLAYSKTALAGVSAPVPLSFAEGEVFVGNGSSAEPAGAGDTTGRLSVVLAPVIYGGQLLGPANAPRATTQPITVSELIDAGSNAIPTNAYQSFPPFANTPYVSDSDASGATQLEDLTTGQSGSAIALSLPTDQLQIKNSGTESAGRTITATIKFAKAAADATFVIPAYFGFSGSVSALHTIPPPGSAALTFSCTSAGCVKGS